MALPASGPISMSMVRTELQNEGKSTTFELSKIGCLLGSETNTGSGYVPVNRSATTKPTDDVTPSAITEWYSYNHSANQNCPTGDISTPTMLGSYLYYRINVTGSVGSVSSITMDSPDNTLNSTVRCQIYTSYPFTNTGALTGFPIFDGTFANTNFQTYNYTLSSTSQVLYFVIWDEGGVAINLFTVYALNSTSCSGGDVRVVKASNNSTTLTGAVGATLYRMPQNAILTGYTYVRDEDGTIRTLTSGVVGSIVANC